METLARLDRRAGGQGGATGNRSKIVRRALHEFLSRAEKAAERAEQAAEEDRERDIFRRNRVRLGRQAAALVKAQAKP